MRNYYSKLYNNAFRIITQAKCINSHTVRTLNTSEPFKIHSRKYSYLAPLHKNVELYDTAAGIPLSIAKQSLIKYASHHGTNLSELKLQGKILDVGCGQGAVTNYLVQYLDPAATIDGFDISEDIIDFANEKYSDHMMKFFAMDAGGRVPDGMIRKYDFIISNLVLQWAKEHRKILNNMVKMLKPNRDSLLVFFKHNPLYTSWRDLSKMSKWSPYMTDVERFIPTYQDVDKADVHFKGVMLESGFRNAHVEVVDIEYGYRYSKHDLSVYRSLFQGVNPFILRIPNEEEREMFMDDMMISFIRNGGFKNYDLSKSYGGGSLVYNCSLIIAIGST